jgi:hypothetical protein
VKGWDALEAEVARIIAESPEPFAAETTSQINDFLKYIRGRTTIPEVTDNPYRTTLRVMWGPTLEFEVYGDHLEIYEFREGATDIRHVPHAAGEPFPPEVEAALPPRAEISRVHETLNGVVAPPRRTMTSLPQGRDKLFWLMDLLMVEHHDAGTFCREFERTFNFEVDMTTLSDAERKAFSALFDKVVWYSPYPVERQVVPNYQSGAQIREAVREARRVLGLS